MLSFALEISNCNIKSKSEIHVKPFLIVRKTKSDNNRKRAYNCQNKHKSFENMFKTPFDSKMYESEIDLGSSTKLADSTDKLLNFRSYKFC